MDERIWASSVRSLETSAWRRERMMGSWWDEPEEAAFSEEEEVSWVRREGAN